MLPHVWQLATPWTVARQAPLSRGFPGKNTRVGCHALCQGIFLTQELNPCLLHWKVDSLPSESRGKPCIPIDPTQVILSSLNDKLEGQLGPGCLSTSVMMDGRAGSGWHQLRSASSAGVGTDGRTQAGCWMNALGPVNRPMQGPLLLTRAWTLEGESLALGLCPFLSEQNNIWSGGGLQEYSDLTTAWPQGRRIWHQVCN